jgi:hypothetical protein
MYEQPRDTGNFDMSPDGFTAACDDSESAHSGVDAPDHYYNSGIVRPEEDQSGQYYVEVAEMLRGTADDRSAVLYERNIPMSLMSERRSHNLARAVCSRFHVDPRTSADATVLVSAYKKMVFHYTDPSDYTDTLSDMFLLVETAGLWRELAESEDPTVATLEQLAALVDLHAAYASVYKWKLDEHGELCGLSAEAQFNAVKYTVMQSAYPEENAG